MSTISPGFASALTQAPIQPAPNSAARTAQQAFFRAALDRVQAPPLADVTAQAARVAPVEDAAEDTTPTQRLPRLGALLDIRV